MLKIMQVLIPVDTEADGERWALVEQVARVKGITVEQAFALLVSLDWEKAVEKNGQEILRRMKGG